MIPASTIQETVYVLERLYHLEAAAIAPKLISLLAIPNVDTPGSRWILEALQFYRVKNSDFGDALLCAFARSEGCDVATFDKGIAKKFSEVTVLTPAEYLTKTKAGCYHVRPQNRRAVYNNGIKTEHTQRSEMRPNGGAARSAFGQVVVVLGRGARDAVLNQEFDLVAGESRPICVRNDLHRAVMQANLAYQGTPWAAEMVAARG